MSNRYASVDAADFACLVAEVQDLTSTVRQLIATTPQRTKTWLEPRELATLVGVSTRTVANWREAGRFRERSHRPSAKGYQYHSKLALEDVDVQWGSRSPLLSD